MSCSEWNLTGTVIISNIWSIMYGHVGRAPPEMKRSPPTHITIQLPAVNSLDQCPLVHSSSLSLNINKETLPLDIQTHRYLCWEFPMRRIVFFPSPKVPMNWQFRAPSQKYSVHEHPQFGRRCHRCSPQCSPGNTWEIEPIQSKYLWLKEWIIFHLNKDVWRQSQTNKLQWWMLCFPFAA